LEGTLINSQCNPLWLGYYPESLISDSSRAKLLLEK
jgi:hypothetical protein